MKQTKSLLLEHDRKHPRPLFNLTLWLSLLVVVLAATSIMSVAVASETVSAQEVGLEYLETELRKEQYYNIPDQVATIDFFENLIATLSHELGQYHYDANFIYLAQGDAYHWLGHLFERRGRISTALNYYQLSYGAYQKSTIVRSPSINNLKTIEHAVLHIRHVSQLLGIRVGHFLDMYSGDDTQFSVTQVYVKTDMKAYISRLKNITQGSAYSSHIQCYTAVGSK